MMDAEEMIIFILALAAAIACGSALWFMLWLGKDNDSDY